MFKLILMANLINPIQLINIKQDIEHIRQIHQFSQYLSGALQGHAKTYIDVANRYDIDVYLLIAISLHETGYGKSYIANNNNNICGCMTSNGAMSFSSIDASIDYMARNLKENYINKGLDTIAKIQTKYAPVNAKNDPNNLNAYWSNSVTSIYSKIGGQINENRIIQ